MYTIQNNVYKSKTEKKISSMIKTALYSQSIQNDQH